MSVILTYNSAQGDAQSIKREVEISESILVDILEAGHLKQQGRELVFSDKNWNEITTVTIEHLGDESHACKWGFRITCRKEKQTPVPPSIPKATSTQTKT